MNAENDIFPLSPSELIFLRDKINYYMMDQDYENSVFWAEKVYMLSKMDKDLYIYLQNLMISKRFRQALAIIENKYVDLTLLTSMEKYLEKAPLWVRYFAAKCSTNLGKCSKSLELLYDVEPTKSLQELKSNTSFTISHIKSQLNRTKFDSSTNEDESFVDHSQLLASAARLKGTILEYMGDNNAASYFVTSLTKDVFHYSSARKLFENKMISPKEVHCLIEEYSNLVYDENHENDENEICCKKLNKLAISFYLLSSELFSPYTNNIRQDQEASRNNTFFMNKDIKIWPESLVNTAKKVLEKFYESCDIMRWQASSFIGSDNVTKALQITETIINTTNMDDHLGCVMHALILFKCCRTIDLKIMCDLLSVDANLSINKQIVYKIVCSVRDLSIGNASKSQENLRNSVKLAAIAALRSTAWLISPAILWLILGHAAWLAGDKEHALASFNSAADTSPGLYITWFFIGALHSETEETSLALTYFVKAHRIATNQFSGVPLFMANEIACSLAKKGNYQMAIRILLNSLGDAALDDRVLLNCVIENKQPKLYLSLLHNLSYCCFKNNMLRESLRFVQMAHSIDQSSMKTQKLLGVLLDYFGHHKDAQFLYQNVILEISKISELKFSVKGRTLKGRNCHILPPESANTFQTREHDLFCVRMIERSLMIEKKKTDLVLDEASNISISMLNEQSKNPTSFKNTSLSFDDQ